MLTQSRFAEELIAAGVLDDAAAAGSAFVIPVRDPGAITTRGQTAGARSRRAAADAGRGAGGRRAATPRSAGGHGIVATPYRSYRGTEVIGVWRWLPAYDMGVIAEISAAEAFAALRYFWISCGGDRRASSRCRWAPR